MNSSWDHYKDSLAEEQLVAETNDEYSDKTSSDYLSGRNGARPSAGIQLLCKKTVPNWAVMVLFLLTISISFSLSVISNYMGSSFPNLAYSPATSAVEYRLDVFARDENYMPPFTDEKDKLWGRFENIMTGIDRDQAAHLDQITLEVPGHPGRYVIVLDVFHQLHCLNYLRQFTHPERYHLLENVTESQREASLTHRDHCIESIRESLVCSGDISPIVFTLDSETNAYLPDGRTSHTCRNFDKIEEWARENTLEDDWEHFKSKLRPGSKIE